MKIAPLNGRRRLTPLFVFIISALLWTFAPDAQADPQEYIDSGEQSLFSESIDSILDAHATFEEAVALYPDHPVLNGYLAITRLGYLAFTSDSVGATPLINQYGITRLGTDIDSLDYELPRDINDKYDVPPGAPTSETVRSYLHNEFLNAVDASIANLDVTIDNWNSTSKHIASIANTGRDQDIEMDWGDAWLFRSLLKAFKSIILIVAAYDLDVDLREIAALENLEALKFADVLDRYQSFLKLLPQPSNASVNGGDLLEQARLSLIDAINDYETASAAIRNDYDLTLYAEELVEIDECDQRVEVWMRDILTRVRNSLAHTAGPGSDVLIVKKKERWRFTLVEDGSGSEYEIHIREWESDSSDALYTTTSGGEIVGWSGDITCITIDGNAVYLKSESHSWPYMEIEFSGTLSSEGDQNLITGDYSGWGWNGAISGDFTGVQDSVLDVEEKTELINPNPAFGKDKGPYDLRDFLPPFNECDDPVYGTVGYGLDPILYDPTIGGILLDFNQDDWGIDQDPCILGNGTISGSLSIPNFSDSGTIFIQAFRYDGWYNLDPANRIGMQTIYAEEFTEGMDYSLDYVPSGYPAIVSTWWDLNSNGIFNYEDVEMIPPDFTPQPGDNLLDLTIGVDVAGIVFQSDGVTPVAANGITVYAIQGDPCGYHWAIGSAPVNPADGTYTIDGLSVGSYYFKATSSSLPNYTGEWWTDPGDTFGTLDCTLAEPVAIDSLGRADIDFQLEVGDEVSGRAAAATGSGVEGLLVQAFSNKCGGKPLPASAETDATGNFTIYGIPADNVYLKACASCRDLLFVDAWWNGVGGAANCSDATPVGDSTDEFSDDVDFHLQGKSIFNSQPPAIDIVSGGSGAITWTTNSDNPETDLILEAKIIDHDGIAPDGSSHLVQVEYPSGIIKTLDFVYRNPDGISALYEWYDNVSDIAGNPDNYSGNYTFSVTDPHGDVGEAVDSLEVNPVNPPDEDGAPPDTAGFLPALNPAQSIRAYFDDVCPYDDEGNIDPEGCDDFSDGIDPSDWNPYPSNVYPQGGRVVIEHIGSLGRAPTWLNTNNIPQDEGPLDFKATVQIDDPGTSDKPVARIAGNFCRVGDSDIFAMVGIRSNGEVAADAVFAVAKTRWEGSHFIVENIVDVTAFGTLSANPHYYRYDIRLQWNGASVFNFFVVGLDADNINYHGSVDLSDYFDPQEITAPQNAWAGMGVATWNRLNTTTPEFDWAPVDGATYYRVRIYGLNNSTIYRGNTTAPPFRMPPGILKPNAIYKYRIEAIRDHQYFEWDNVGRSDRDLTVFFTGDTEAQAPAVDLSNSGVYTWTNPEPYGANTWFYVKVHDAQGVPGNIASVKVTMPDSDGTEVDLYLDSTEGPTTGVYRGVYFGGTPPGLYLFTVKDKDGHENQQPIPLEEDEENNEILGSNPIAYPPEDSLVPSNYDTVDDTQVTFSWDPVSDVDGGAAFYQLYLYDKDFNYLFNIKTENNEFTLPPGRLQENSLYKYRLITRREFFEDNIDNGATVPPFSAGNANDFITTPTYGSNPPVIDDTTADGDPASDGVAVYQAPSHVSDDPVYWLTFYLKVEDDDGVPENIQRVEVTFPHPDPDGATSMVLKYNPIERWSDATQSNELVANYYNHKIYLNPATIPNGTYTFRVFDFDSSPVATFTDDLPNIVPGLIDWPAEITPAEGSIVDSTTPIIEWDAVDGAGYYRVLIMSAWNFPTVHWSGKLTGTQYTVPAQVLDANVLYPDTTYGLRVYAYQGDPDSEIDFYAGSSSRHVANQRFTVAGHDSDGDFMDDAWEVFHFGDLTHDGSGHSDADNLTDLEEFQTGTDPHNPDTDADTFLDHADNCPAASNPAGNWTDIDGVGHTAEQPDFDLDGRGDACDNCPQESNPDQADLNRDGAGDVCEVYSGCSPTPPPLLLNFNLWSHAVGFSDVFFKDPDTGALLNDGKNFVTVNPGDEITVSVSWSSDFFSGGYCPTCAVQLYYGIRDQFSVCFAGNLGSHTHRSGIREHTFTAPTEPGFYYITPGGTLDYNCWPATNTSMLPESARAMALVVVGSPEFGDLDGDALGNPCDDDVDGDGILNDVDDDDDNDGLLDADEASNNTDPYNPDSDGDGVDDAAEVASGTDPTDPSSFIPQGTAAMRGTVTDADQTPITDALVYVQAVTGNPCSGWTEAYATQANPIDGDFILVGITPGQQYYLRAYTTSPHYAGEWWTGSFSSENCYDALPVDAIANELVDDVFFQLDAYGSVSGVVSSDPDPGGQLLEGIAVQAYDYSSGHFKGSAQTRADGTYTIDGLPAGTYRIQIAKGIGYAWEYYDDTSNHSSASAVVVTDGADTPGIDFSLAAGATISGTVTTGAGTLGLAGIRVSAYDFTTGHFGGSAQTESDGTYTITGLPAGSYRVETQKGIDYAWEYFDDTSEQSSATAVTVTVGENRTGIDFDLVAGGSISGMGTSSSPAQCVQGIWVYAYAYSTGTYAGSTQTVSGGSYLIKGLPAGSYRVQIQPGTDYGWEYYDDTSEQSLAAPVTVAVGIDTPGTDFHLAAGASISGTVTRDAGGGAIAGLWIYAYDYTTGSWRGQALTQSNGSYLIKGLPAGSYRVQAGSSNYDYLIEYYNNTYDQSAAEAVTLSAGEERSDIHFGLTEGGSISGVITEDAGSPPIPGVRVYANDHSTGLWGSSAQSQSDGTYTIRGLRTGSYRVQASSPETGHLGEYYIDTYDHAAAAAVAVVAGEDTPDIDFGLTMGGSIIGRVTNASGDPIPGVSVYAEGYQFGGGWGSSQTDGNGEYAIRSLNTGGYKVRVDAAGTQYVGEYYNDTYDYESAITVDVTVGVDTNISDIVLAVGGSISGAVIDDLYEQGIGGLSVRAENLATEQWYWGAPTDSQGAYTIIGLPTGDYNVHVSNSGTEYAGEYYDDTYDPYSATAVGVTMPNESSGIDFSLAVGGSISGTVTDSDSGMSVPSVWVSVYNEALNHWDGISADATGNFTFRGLVPGCYDINVGPDAAGNYLSYHQDEAVNLDIGETRTGVIIALEAGQFSLSGTVTYQEDPSPNISLFYENEARDIWLSTSTGSDGTYAFTNLPPGPASITVQAWGTGFAFKTTYFDLTADRDDFDIALDDQACVTGQVVDQNGNGLPGVWVDVEVEPGEFELEGSTDGNGNFSICNLPQGIGHLAVDPGFDSGFCEPADRTLYINGGVENRVGLIRLQPCTLVQGSYNFTGSYQDCFDRDDVEIWSEGVDFDADAEVEPDGTFRILLPDGDHPIYFEMDDDDEPYKFVAYPSTVEIIDGVVQTSGPAVLEVIYDNHNDAGTINGSIRKANAADPDPAGRMMLALLLPGSLQNVTPESLAGVAAIQEMTLTGFGSFSLSPVPPGTYDVVFMLHNESPAEVETITVLGFDKDVEVQAGASVWVPVPPPGEDGGPFDYVYSPAIDGNVVDNFGRPVVGAEVIVTAAGGEFVALAETDETGHYVIHNPQAGPLTAEGYHPQYSGSPVTTAAPGDTASDLTLTARTVTGTVTIEGTGAALEDVWIEIVAGDRCDVPIPALGVQTDANGNFTADNLPDGDLFIKACPTCVGLNYVVEWWDGDGSQGAGAIDCSQAAPIAIIPDQAAQHINIDLVPGGTIEGHVTDSGGSGLPNVWVEAFLDAPCWNGPFVASVPTDENGNYALTGLPAGEIFVRTCAACNGLNHVDEWYDADQGSLDCNGLVPIAMTTGATVSDIDFGLAAGESISGFLYDQSDNVIVDSLISIHAIPVDATGWHGQGTNVSQDDGSFRITGLPPGGYKILANNNREQSYETKYYPDDLFLHDADTITVIAGTEEQLSQPVNLEAGPPTHKLTLFLQKRARVHTDENVVNGTQMTAHVRKEFWIERWRGSRATLADPDIVWEPGEPVENIYVDLSERTYLPDHSTSPNSPAPRYIWTSLPDFTLDEGWLGVLSSESSISTATIPADIVRSVDQNRFSGPATQEATLAVTVHDPEIARIDAYIYFDDKEIVAADEPGGDGSRSSRRWTIRHPVAGKTYTFTQDIALTPRNNDGHDVIYIPRTRVRLNYPDGPVSDGSVSLTGSEISVDDPDIGVFTVSPGDTPVLDAVYKRSPGRIEVEQRRIIQEVDAAAPRVDVINSNPVPDDNAANVPVGAAIDIPFSEPMSTARVEQRFTLYDENGNAVHDPSKGVSGGTFSWDADHETLTFTPTQDLARGTGYEILVLGSDKSGEWMRWTEGGFYWDFVTEPDQSDTTPPTVVSTWPADGDLAASTTGFNPRSLLTHITAIFSETMDPDTLNAANISFTKITDPGTPTAVDFSLSYHLKLLEIIPAAPLAEDSVYEIVFSTDIEDANGNALGSAFSWSFTTSDADDISPQVVETLPANGATDVDVWYPRINIYIDEEVDPSTVTAANVKMSLADDEDNPIDFYPEYWNKDYGIRLRRGASLRFLPLDNNNTYTVTIDTTASGVKDRAGNPLDGLADGDGDGGSFQFSFTTVASEGNSFPGLDRIRKADVTRYPDGIQFDFLLYGNDNEQWWPGEILTVTATDGSNAWDLVDAGDRWTFDYQTLSGTYETIGTGDQTLTFEMVDTAGNTVSVEKDVHVFITVPVITTPTESQQVMGPVTIGWSFPIGLAPMYQVTVYDGPNTASASKV